MTAPDDPAAPVARPRRDAADDGSEAPDEVEGADEAAGAHHVEGADEGGGGDDEEVPPGRRRLRSAVEWVLVIAGALLVALLVRTFLFTTFWIPSGSMEPTLMGGDRRDRVVVNRLAYRIGDPERGDIVVFEVPPGEPTITVDGQEVNDLIKRIVGLPGETVELRDGAVFVDGERLDEDYLPEGTRTEPCTPGVDTFEVPDDAVFVLGDNRGMSRDARCWDEPWVDEDSIVGKAVLRVWPLSELGRI